jgi:hypothetical protein
VQVRVETGLPLVVVHIAEHRKNRAPSRSVKKFAAYNPNG